ncbi:MAG TPA: PhzF family phenazine biosynthesis protein [Gemmatimonadaceae bacterium]|nr:PhzF family phenazine biosynthesis protein [Gemmatimonadaceae bacterium]
MDARFLTADVFTTKTFGGNQLAVFPDATGIPEELLLPITREFNYSETTFCYPPANPAHSKRVRIFTPAGEIPFAGHPTVGTAHVLVAKGLVPASGDAVSLVLEEGVGPISVAVRLEGGVPVFAQLSVAKLPEIGPQPPSRGSLAEILSLEAHDVLYGASSPQAISCGLPFLMVPLRDVDAVTRSRVRTDRWEPTLKAYWAPDMLVFAPDPSGGPAHYRARVFVPGQGIVEDPATGSANACLAGYLAQRAPERDGTIRWTVDQGVEMGRPSRLELEADKKDGVITAIRVGGATVIVSEGVMRLPERTSDS